MSAVAKEKVRPEMKKKEERTLEEAFLWRYPRRNIVLEHYMHANKVTPEWGNLTNESLRAFAEYLRVNCSQNTAAVYCSMMKALLTLYSDIHTPPEGYKKALTVRMAASTHIYLSTDEIRLIENYAPKTSTEVYVRNTFLIGCYTGCRLSDFCTLTEGNITPEGNLDYVSRKTKIRAVVPLKPSVGNLILGTESRTITEPTYNSTIRRICREVGINRQVRVYKSGMPKDGEKWAFVSSHTARRSFATNLYLLGLDIYTISAFLGHSSVEMTAKNYICCAVRELPDGVKGFFQ